MTRLPFSISTSYFEAKALKTMRLFDVVTIHTMSAKLCIASLKTPAFSWMHSSGIGIARPGSLTRVKLACAVAFLFATTAWAQAPIDAATQLFAQYVGLGHAYDPMLADLYSDDAVIKNKRTYPTGEVREITIPAPRYKALIREVMPLAKARGDRSTFSQVSYSAEGERVRIRASRFSELRKYTSPVSLLVGPSARGTWLIYEESTESRP